MLLGSLGCVLGFVRFVGGRWVHWGTPWGLSVALGVAGFIRVPLGGRRVLSGSLGALGCALGTSGSFGVAEFIGLRPGGHPVRSR